MRNNYLDEDECKKNMEWQGVSTQEQRDLHPRGEEKTARVFRKRKRKKKRGNMRF